MTVKIKADVRDAIVEEFKNKRPINELATAYGYPAATISRALADAGVHSLSNYKTAQEHTLLEVLRKRGITNVSELRLRYPE